MIGNGSESGNDRDEVEAGHGSRVRWEVEGGRVRVQVQRQQGESEEGRQPDENGQPPEEAKEVAPSNGRCVNRGGSESSEEEVQTTSTCLDQNCNGTDCDTDTTTGYNGGHVPRAGHVHALMNPASCTFDASSNVALSVAARDPGRGTSSAASHANTATGSSTPSMDDVAELIARDPEVIGTVQRAMASLLFGPARANPDSAASDALATLLDRAGDAPFNDEDRGSGMEDAGHQEEDRKPAARPAGSAGILVSSQSPSDGPCAVTSDSVRPGVADVAGQVVRTVLLTDEEVARLLEERGMLMGGDRPAARDVGVVCTSCSRLRRYEHRSGPRPLEGGDASLAEADLTPSGTDESAVGEARAGPGRAGRTRQRVVATGVVSADHRTPNCDAAVAAATSAKPPLVSTSTAAPPVKSVSFSSVSAPHFHMDDDEEDEEDGHNRQYSYGQSQLIPSRQAGVPRGPYHEYEDEDGGDLHQDDDNYPFHRRFSRDEYETARRERHRNRHFHRRNRRTSPRTLSASPPTSSFSSLAAQGGGGDEAQRMMRGRTRGRSHSPSSARVAAESFVPLVTEGHSTTNARTRTGPHQGERGRRDPSASFALSDLSHTEAVSAGETTASGDSSVASGHHGGERPSSVISATTPQVHFSAMNPNPQLVLDPHNQPQTSNNDHQQSHIPIVRFTVDRAVSFEDELLSNNHNTNTSNTASGGSRASRSGLSSPSIEPALSPPRSRSRSPFQIHFDDSAITTITEAAARLRRGQQMRPDHTDSASAYGSGVTSADEDSSQRPTVGRLARPSSRVVHFSAMRDVTVVDVDASAASSLNSAPSAPLSTSVMEGSSSAGTASTTASTSNNALSNDLGERGFTGSATHSHNTVVHFAESESASAQFRPIPFPGTVVSNHHTEAEMGAVAERLRRLIRRAEQINNVTLEAAFAHFDQDHSGTITPRDLQIGLRTLGESFCFSLEECSALLECLSSPGRQSGRCNATDNGVARSGIYDWEEGGNLPRQEPGINLLGFYRAMGRRSPPPIDVEEGPGDGNFAANGDDDADDDNAGGLSAAVSRGRRATPLARVQMDLASSPVVHAHDAASRLRDIILEAEQNDGMPLESSFRLLDPAGSGYITASDFHRGLLELGRGRIRRSNENEAVSGRTEVTVEENEEDEGGINAFARINDDDCEELVALFDTNGDGLVSLLDFYRFMGRRSPPLRSEGELTDDDGSDRDDGSDQM